MLKRKTKFIIIVAIITFAICLFNANIVNAANQNSLDNVPDTISVGIPTTKALNGIHGISNELKSIIEEKVKESITDDITGNYIVLSRDYDNKFSDVSKVIVQLSKNSSPNTDKNNIIAEKTITVKYTDSWNTTDKNMAIQIAQNNIPTEFMNIKYDYVSPYKDIFENMIGNKGPEDITQLLSIKNSNIKVIYHVGAGGDPVWACNYGRALVYVNNVLYGDTNFGLQYIPVFKIPANIEDTDKANIDYVTNILKTDTIEEFGTIWDVYWGGNATIEPNPSGEKGSYIIYNSNSTSPLQLFIKKEQNNSLEIKDESTNIKIETDTATVPANTKLVVNEIKQGEKYNNIEKILKNSVNKMYIYDTSLQNNGVEVQPNGKLKISIPIPNDLDVSNIVVYRITEDGTKTECLATIENGYAIIETDNMGIYVLGEKTNVVTGATENEKDDTPKTGTTSNAVFLSIILSLSVITLLSVKKYNAKH